MGPRGTTPIGWGALIAVFGRIGLLSFGGPAAQIALMQRELVDRLGWLERSEFLRALSLCMLLPGPEAMQLCTFAGWRLRGTAGGILAGALFVLPGACAIAALVGLYVAFGQLSPVQAAFLGVKAAVIVIVLQALASLGARTLTSVEDRAIAALSFAAIFALDLPFPAIVLAAGLWGALRASGAPAPAPAAPDAAPARPLRTLAIWGTAWLGPLGLLWAAGPTLLAEIAALYARFALLSFGGAYALLAWLAQTMTDSHGWITPEQMIDALGLAETTPGPLILVTQFVAMLAGAAQGGPGLALAAGAVSLWALFLPCFLFIFLAAPHLGRLDRRPRLAAALAAITAAVAGVILDLSVWFALHVLFGSVGEWRAGPLALPLPAPDSFRPAALALAGLAAVLLLRLRWPLPLALIGTALAGLALGAA